MAKTIFTTITPLPPNISRAVVLETLHDHLEMIDLNPSHAERTPCKPPANASPEEYHCQWYSITDKVSYLPANLASGTVSFNACFHDLINGLQTHCYAPMGLDIKEKWTIGGNEPGEPAVPREIGINAPVEGLYLREDVTMKCNFLMTRFVRKTLQESLKALVARLVVKAQLQEAEERNRRLTMAYSGSEQGMSTPPLSPPMRSPGMSLGPGGVGRAPSRGSSYSVSSTGKTPLTPPLSAGYPGDKWLEAQSLQSQMQMQHQPLQMHQQQHVYQPFRKPEERNSYGGYPVQGMNEQQHGRWSSRSAGRAPAPLQRYGSKPQRVAELQAPPGPVELP